MSIRAAPGAWDRSSHGVREIALPALWGISGIRQRVVAFPSGPRIGGEAAREREFRLGRAIAAELLHEEGSVTGMVGVGRDRAPQWPRGFTGTISHSSTLLGVAIARQDAIGRRQAASSGRSSIGLDIESIIEEAALDDIRGFCLSGEERYACRALLGERDEVGVTTIFSAKEALFKCLYPIVRSFFDFSDVTIDLTDFRTSRIGAQLKRALSPELPAGTEVSGRCHFVEQHVITAFNWSS